MASKVMTSEMEKMTNLLAKATLKEPEVAVMRLHGILGDKLTENESKKIIKHLDIIQLVTRGDECTSTKDLEHPHDVHNQAIWGGKGYTLWEDSIKGAAERDRISKLLSDQWGKNGGNKQISNEFTLYDPDYNWNFSNESQQGEYMTFQGINNNEAMNATKMFSKNFTLLDLANKVATGGLSDGSMGMNNQMELEETDGTPQRAKLIIMACQGWGTSGAKHGGSRRSKRKKQKTRKKMKKRKTRKKRKKRKTRRKRKRLGKKSRGKKKGGAHAAGFIDETNCSEIKEHPFYKDCCEIEVKRKGLHQQQTIDRLLIRGQEQYEREYAHRHNLAERLLDEYNKRKAVELEHLAAMKKVAELRQEIANARGEVKYKKMLEKLDG
jgi:hypothetical protein